MMAAHLFKVNGDEVHVTGVLAVHAVLLVHEVVSGALQLHQLAMGLQQLRLLDQLLCVGHNLWDCAHCNNTQLSSTTMYTHIGRRNTGINVSTPENTFKTR